MPTEKPNVKREQFNKFSGIFMLIGVGNCDGGILVLIPLYRLHCG